MKVILLLIILALFFIFKKENFTLDDTVRTISADRWSDILKPNRKYINQIDYYQPQGLDYKDAPQIDLERAILNSPITSDDINWEKLSDYEYVQMVGLLQGNYNRPLIKSINAS
jgi:hypothetical protein